MVAGEPGAEIRGLVGQLRRREALNGDVLDQHVRGHDDHADERPMGAPRVDQRDRRSVAVADQDRALDPELVEQRGEGDQGLFVHEIHPASVGDLVRLTMSEAGVHQGAMTRCGREPGGEIAPQAEGARSFVEEDQARSRRTRPGDQRVLETMTQDVNEHEPRYQISRGGLALGHDRRVTRSSPLRDGLETR